MKRGELRLANIQGDHGKRRPYLIMQNDWMNSDHATILSCMVTGTVLDLPLYRINVFPDDNNGLDKHSQISADKIFAIRRGKFSEPIGIVDDETMASVDRAVSLCLGLPVT